MYQPMLFVHWKQIRLGLIPFIVASFGLPLLAVQGLGTPPGAEGTTVDAYRVVTEFEVWLPFFPLLAVAIGMTLALSAWNWDHRYDHVYALSLPLARWEYAMLKMGAGAALALLPAAAFWIGAHLAAGSVNLPEGLHAYPNLLALRFTLAILVTYGVLFAMAAGTIKTTVWITSAVIGFTVFGSFATDFLAMFFDTFQTTNVVEWAFQLLIDAPGPFELFSGSWTLIDV